MTQRTNHEKYKTVLINFESSSRSIIINDL